MGTPVRRISSSARSTNEPCIGMMVSVVVSAEHALLLG